MLTAIAYLIAAGQDRSILRYQLDNGLDVILVPDQRAPMVVVELAYKAGVMNEPPGRSGFAHLFEHLMFAGTPAIPDVDAAYGSVGVDLNASTWDDHTLYHARGMSSTLPFILSVEADRMANQGHYITRDVFEVQRGVVINEISQNVLDNVAGAAWEAFPSALFHKSHPYSRSVYGSIPDLRAATLDDAKALFGAFYVPNNAILAIVGDFQPNQAADLIAETFGRIPRGGDVPAIDVAHAPTRSRLVLRDRVPTDMVFAGWSVPSLRENDLSLLRVVAELIGNSEYGVLRRALVDRAVANGAWVHLQQGLLASRFILQVSAAEGIDAASVETAALDAVADFLARPVADEDFVRARKRIFIDDRVANEDPLRFADNIVAFTQAKDDPTIAAEDDRTIAVSTPTDVGAAARRWLRPDDASVAHVLPGRSRGLPPILGKSSGPRTAMPMIMRPLVDVAMHRPNRPVTAQLPRAERFALANGLELVHYTVPHSPLLHLAAASSVGTLSAPAGKEGIVELATAMAIRGAGERRAAEFGMASRDLGAEFETQTESLSAFITLSVPLENLSAATSMLADVLLRPRFDEDEFDVAKAETLSELALRESDPGDVAARYGEAALFPRRPGQAAIDRSIASTRAISRADAEDAFGRIFAPTTTTLHSVGPAPIDTLVATLSPVLGQWAARTEPYTAQHREPATIANGKRVVVVPDDAATQVALYLALPAPGPDEAGFAEVTAVYRLLNHDFNSRLNGILREQLAVTYGTDGGLFDDVRKGAALTIEVAVEQASVGRSLTEILRVIGGLATDPVREEELERTRIAYLTAMAATDQTGQGLFEEICRRLGHGSSLEEAHRRRLDVVGLDLAKVRRQAVELASLDRVLIVAVGDPDAIVPQCEAIGLAPEVVARTL